MAPRLLVVVQCSTIEHLDDMNQRLRDVMVVRVARRSRMLAAASGPCIGLRSASPERPYAWTLLDATGSHIPPGQVACLARESKE